MINRLIWFLKSNLKTSKQKLKYSKTLISFFFHFATFLMVLEYFSSLLWANDIFDNAIDLFQIISKTLQIERKVR